MSIKSVMYAFIPLIPPPLRVFILLIIGSMMGNLLEEQEVIDLEGWHGEWLIPIAPEQLYRSRSDRFDSTDNRLILVKWEQGKAVCREPIDGLRLITWNDRKFVAVVQITSIFSLAQLYKANKKSKGLQFQSWLAAHRLKLCALKTNIRYGFRS